MKLRKLSERLTLRNAIATIEKLMAAIVTLIMVFLFVVWWVLPFLGQAEVAEDLLYVYHGLIEAWLNWLKYVFFMYYRAIMAWGLWEWLFLSSPVILFTLFTGLIGCLFIVRDVYILRVANKHGRITIVARALGALGASGAFAGFLVWPLFPIGVAISLMAIKGVKLALARPKVAGVWMLLAGIVPGIVFLLLGVLARILLGLGMSPDDVLDIVLVLYISVFKLVPASFFLILGGLAALLSARKKGRQERLASMSMG